MELIDICKAACRVKYSLQTLSDNKINEALYSIAEALVSQTDSILEANAIDLANGKAKNMPEGLLDRLALSDVRIKAMADGLNVVAALENPKGRIIESFTRPNGMMIDKIRVIDSGDTYLLPCK